MYQSLHCHTKSSDGSLTHLQVLNLAAKYQISVIAFTDHDILPDARTVKQLQALKPPTCDWIIGCELSCSYPPECGGGVSHSLHIVGLFLDPFNQSLLERNQKTQVARIQRMQRIVANLQGLGFKITTDDCLQASGGESVGRPHIVQALFSHPKNEEIIDQLVSQFKTAAQKDASLKHKYRQMISDSRGKPGYVYYLFLTHDALIPGIYVPYLYSTPLDEAVKLIRNAGGVSFLAHWSFEKQKLNPQLLEQLFRQNRLDGAEILYGMPTDFETFPDLIKDMEIVRQLTEKHQRLQSGGGDLHTPDHFSDFVNGPTAKFTVGLTQKLISDPRVNPSWSSFASESDALPS